MLSGVLAYQLLQAQHTLKSARERHFPPILPTSLSLSLESKSISDVRYVSIYRNIDIFVEYRDTILAFGCIDTLEWTV